jgi:crotonobetainyl-CoA:carnitine CoA-transferase CaiB-like acyl-CoA transferase
MVEVPMLESVTSFWLTEHLFNHTYVPPRGDIGYTRILSPDRKPYPTKDGYVCAVLYSGKHWEAFVRRIGRPELLTDPRFATQAARANNQVGMQAIIAAAAPSMTTAEWLAFFDEADIPAMGVNDLPDLFEDPHLKATGFFTTREHPTEGMVRTTASPFDFSGTPTSYRRHAPLLGADGAAVLEEAGFTAEEISSLTASGALQSQRSS